MQTSLQLKFKKKKKSFQDKDLMRKKPKLECSLFLFPQRTD